MITRSELMRITGATRSALEGYDKKGILHPVDKDESDKLLYDDSAVNMVIAIQMLQEFGYSREEIKAFCENDNFDWEKAFDNAIESMREKQKELEGKITIIKCSKMVFRFPVKIQQLLDKVNIESWCNEVPFAEALSKNIKRASEDKYEEGEIEENLNEPLVLLCVMFCFMGYLNSYGPNSPEIRAYVREVYNYCLNTVDEETRNDLNNLDILDNKLKYGEYHEIVKEFFEDKEIMEGMRKEMSADKIEFIRQAFEEFDKNI